MDLLQSVLQMDSILQVLPDSWLKSCNWALHHCYYICMLINMHLSIYNEQVGTLLLFLVTTDCFTVLHFGYLLTCKLLGAGLGTLHI
jgi:hypothetical protein